MLQWRAGSAALMECVDERDDRGQRTTAAMEDSGHERAGGKRGRRAEGRGRPRRAVTEDKSAAGGSSNEVQEVLQMRLAVCIMWREVLLYNIDHPASRVCYVDFSYLEKFYELGSVMNRRQDLGILTTDVCSANVPCCD